MNVTLDKTFPMPGSASVAWKLLQDIESVAGCMPGAKITERLDANNYKGTVSVKFGPASMSFRGEIELKQVDESKRVLRLIGKGTDSTGSSGASMDLTAQIEAVDENSSNLVGHSEVSVNGKAAAFGGRMMSSVSDQVLKQFAANFAARVQTLNAQASPAGSGTGSEGNLQQPGEASVSISATAAVADPSAAPTHLSAFGLLWGVIKDWLKSLMGSKK